MKKSKKLFPAIAMLMISAILLTTASYAWFTMSREVTATGMNVTVTAPTNLLISTTETGTYSSSAEVTAATGTKVYPASSIDGTNFFALKDGESVDATSGENTNNAKFVAKNVASTADDAGSYVDFVYYVKTEGDASADKPVNVKINEFTVTKKSEATQTGTNAVRAAVIAKTNAGTSLVATNTNGVNWTADKAIIGVDENASTAKLEAVKYAGTGNVFSLQSTTPVEVTVRVWIEGEDKTCNVGEAANLNFDVKLVLGDASVA